MHSSQLWRLEVHGQVVHLGEGPPPGCGRCLLAVLTWQREAEKENCLVSLLIRTVISLGHFPSRPHLSVIISQGPAAEGHHVRGQASTQAF